MPELPDIEVFSYNLKKQFAGSVLAKVVVVNGKKLQDSQKELSAALEGKKLVNIYRAGKEFRFVFDKNTLLGMHLMLTGDLHLIKGENKYKSTIVELRFADGRMLALTDRMKNANIRLQPQDKEGIDALDPKLNFKVLKEILNRKTSVKNVLLDQDSIRGIGNGYSDEILWETKISPYSTANAIPDEKVKELAKAIKKVLKNATQKILKSHPGLITGEVKDYLVIHQKRTAVSPTGYPIHIDTKGMRKTYYTDEQVLYN